MGTHGNSRIQDIIDEYNEGLIEKEIKRARQYEHKRSKDEFGKGDEKEKEFRGNSADSKEEKFHRDAVGNKPDKFHRDLFNSMNGNSKYGSKSNRNAARLCKGKGVI